MSLWIRMLPRLYRFAVLAVVAWLVHVASLRQRPQDEISLADARIFFPTAERLADGDKRLGGQTVVDSQGRALGRVLTTSPHTDDVVGYSGPNNLLIALDAKQNVSGVWLLTSGDTQAHVDQVRSSDWFWRQFAGWERNKRAPQIEGVSGSTLTSLAMAEAIEKRLGGAITSLRFPEPVTLQEVQSLFPGAAMLEPDQPRVGWHRVLGKSSAALGFAVRTSPHTDNGRGYRGPTELLIALAADGQTVTDVVIRKSYDSPEYVDRVSEDEEFMRSLTGRTIDEWARISFASAGIEGVSGATQTSFAVADGIRRRFAADQSADTGTRTTKNWNPGLLAVIVGGLAMAFTPLRASRRLRVIWQGALVVVFLLWIGDLLSLALLAGWMRHGVPWNSAPVVVLMVVVALVVPWATRRQVYCQQICPHGAAQSWLGRFKRLHVRLPSRLQRWLPRLRSAILIAGMVLAISWLRFDLAWLEPFDGWVLKSGALVSAGVAIVGLITSIFVPQAYCRYACPTGELLSFVKSGGGHDRLRPRDWAAGGLAVFAAIAIALPALPGNAGRLAQHASERRTSEINGKALGTTWSIKVRGAHDTAALQKAVAIELERIESTLSHWRRDSFTSQFNASETTQALEQPAELIALVAHAQKLSRLTSGAYDITVAPLVDAWGFGPSGERASPPTESEINNLLARTGWQKLAVDASDNTLRKSHPQVQIDLGSLLQGYAADRAAQLLDRAGIDEFLVEVGGELFASGSWEVAIEDPRDPTRRLCRVVLADSGLATSGFYRATRQLDGTTAHHLISPLTGRPIAATATLTAVVAPSALDADAWATALLAVGLPDGLQLAEQQGLDAILVDHDYAQHGTPKSKALINGWQSTGP